LWASVCSCALVPPPRRSLIRVDLSLLWAQRGSLLDDEPEEEEEYKQLSVQPSREVAGRASPVGHCHDAAQVVPQRYGLIFERVSYSIYPRLFCGRVVSTAPARPRALCVQSDPRTHAQGPLRRVLKGVTGYIAPGVSEEASGSPFCARGGPADAWRRHGAAAYGCHHGLQRRRQVLPARHSRVAAEVRLVRRGQRACLARAVVGGRRQPVMTLSRAARCGACSGSAGSCTSTIQRIRRTAANATDWCARVLGSLLLEAECAASPTDQLRAPVRPAHLNANGARGAVLLSQNASAGRHARTVRSSAIGIGGHRRPLSAGGHAGNWLQLSIAFSWSCPFSTLPTRASAIRA
jgi:hypothetical protein